MNERNGKGRGGKERKGKEGKGREGKVPKKNHPIGKTAFPYHESIREVTTPRTASVMLDLYAKT